MPSISAVLTLLCLLLARTPALYADNVSDVCASDTAQPAAGASKPSAQDDAPFSHGLLWKIERPGTAPSYIYGTMHVDVPWVTQLPPRVNLLFAHSRSLVTEVELGETANELYRRRMLLPPEQSLKQMLKPALFQRYMKLAVHYYGLDTREARRLKPWAATNLLARPRPSSGMVLDDVLQRRARSVGKPVHALQTMSALIDDLEAMPRQDQIKVLSDTICNHSRLMKQVPKQLQLYRTQNLAGLMALNLQGPHDDEALFQRMMKRMLYDRSVLMVKRMLPYLEQGKAFVAVGSLHLEGRRGILALLQRRGFKVTRARLER